jgi:hypothetical protein
MSQYKISKKRLAQIIKEEYRSLHEANPLIQNINRWSEEGRDVPLERTVGRADRSDQLDAILSSTRSDFVMKANAADVQKWLDERGLMGGPGASAYNRKDETKKPDFLDLDKDGDEDESFEKAEKDKKEKKVKKESLNSIRDLIKKELANL